MDRQAFSDLALAEMTAVYRLACCLSNRQEADDLVQETYVRAFRSIHTYTPTELGIRSWLIKILYNVFHDHYSKEKRREVVLDGFREEQDTTRSVDEVRHVESADRIDWEQIDERLKAAIQDLPFQHRTVFLLSAIEGLRYREIAAVADIPIGTVMSRLCRARAILASKLADMVFESRFSSRIKTTNSEATPPATSSDSSGEAHQAAEGGREQ